jgi:hypothetical protein
MKFAESYPNVTAKSVGPGIALEVIKESMRDLRQKPVVEGMKHLLSLLTNDFAEGRYLISPKKI